jgi:hypothetical protein
VWGACADMHAHPLRYGAQSLIALYVVQNGGGQGLENRGEVAGYGVGMCDSRRMSRVWSGKALL